VAEHARTGQVSLPYLRDLAAWLRRDVDPDAPAESVPVLLAEIAARTTSPLNIAATATELGYPSRTVFDLRLRRLTSTLAAVWCVSLAQRRHHRLRTHPVRQRDRSGPDQPPDRPRRQAERAA
jgi:hypothetical protein